jgi:hypothetical protein
LPTIGVLALRLGGINHEHAKDEAVVSEASGRFQIASKFDDWYVHDTEKNLFMLQSTYKAADESCYALNNGLVVDSELSHCWRDKP